MGEMVLKEEEKVLLARERYLSAFSEEQRGIAGGLLFEAYRQLIKERGPQIKVIPPDSLLVKARQMAQEALEDPSREQGFKKAARRFLELPREVLDAGLAWVLSWVHLPQESRNRLRRRIIVKEKRPWLDKPKKGGFERILQAAYQELVSEGSEPKNVETLLQRAKLIAAERDQKQFILAAQAQDSDLLIPLAERVLAQNRRARLASVSPPTTKAEARSLKPTPEPEAVKRYPEGGPRLEVKPTPEQEEAVKRYLEGQDLKLVAVAGSGKTTTLRFMAKAERKKKVLYLAFNRAIKEEGERVFPENTAVRTLHGFAHSQVVNRDYQKKLDKGKDNLPPRAIAEVLELPRERYLLAYVIRDTLNAFLTSAADTPTLAHLPASYRLLREQKKGWNLEAEYVLKSVRLLWKLMQDSHDPFPLTHDGYVKMWSQGNPVIRGYDAVLVDEAQDLSPVFLNVLEAHRGKLQRVYVGDPRQQIYAWRGAVNAMARLDAPEAWLTWSFRFGLELAEAVRAYFDYLGDPLPVTGKAPWSTQISMEAPEEPFTVLARTNAGVVEAVAQLALGRSDKKVHVVGGVEELARLLLDADDLKHGRPRSSPHPELSMVWTWEELEMLAQELHHPTAKTLLRLAQRYDLAKLASALRGVHVDEEGAATYILSTAHKAKGREWDRVFLWDDYLEVWEPKVRQTYQEKGDEEELREAENLLYVAMTRARKYLRVMPSLLKVLRRELPPLRETQAPEGGEGRERVIQVRVVQEEPIALEPQGRGILGLAAFLAKIASDPRIPEEIRLEAASWLK
jgi:hypothetical protein